MEGRESANRLQAVAEAEMVSLRARATEAEAALHSSQARCFELESELQAVRRELKMHRETVKEARERGSFIYIYISRCMTKKKGLREFLFLFPSR